MLFLPKHFKYEVEAPKELILAKIEEKIRPNDIWGSSADVYDFKGYVGANSFKLSLNPPYTPSVRRGFIKPMLCGELHESNGKTEVIVDVKFSMQDIIVYLFIVAILLISVVIAYIETNSIIKSLLSSAFAVAVICIVLSFFSRLNLRDTRERLEDIFAEFGYVAVK